MTDEEDMKGIFTKSAMPKLTCFWRYNRCHRFVNFGNRNSQVTDIEMIEFIANSFYCNGTTGTTYKSFDSNYSTSE